MRSSAARRIPRKSASLGARRGAEREMRTAIDAVLFDFGGVLTALPFEAAGALL
jgi:hypothetical protein